MDCASPPQNGYPFCNTDLDIDTRVEDLLSRLNATGKIAQTYGDLPWRFVKCNTAF